MNSLLRSGQFDSRSQRASLDGYKGHLNAFIHLYPDTAEPNVVPCCVSQSRAL